MRPLVLAASLLLIAATAHADAAGPPSCISPPGVGPAPGSTIPANLPAFLFQPGSYPPGLQRPIESFKLGIAEIGQMVPVVVEAGPDRETLLGDGAGAYVWYLVKPERPLRQGEVFLRFDDICGLPTQPITTPMRRDIPYTAGPPLPLPTRLGTATQTPPSGMDPACGRQMIGVQLRLDPALAAFPLIRIEVRAPDGRPLSAALMRRQPDLVEGALVLDCGPAPANSRYLRAGESTVTFSGEVLGGAPLPPVTLALQADCADAGCAVPDAASDGAISDDATADPDLAAADRPREADAELAPADADGPSPAKAGCSCSTGQGPAPGAWLLAALALWARRRRAAQKLPDSTMPPPPGVTTGATRSSTCSSRPPPACGRGRPARARRSSL